MQRRQPQFASGSWHAANPIPASMERRSRRWKSGEDAKSQLKDILEEVSQKHDWPRGSVEQLLSDRRGGIRQRTARDRVRASLKSGSGSAFANRHRRGDLLDYHPLAVAKDPMSEEHGAILKQLIFDILWT